MMAASFVSFIYMGLFAGIIMFAALVADLIFLPAIIFMISGKESQQLAQSAANATNKRAA